jgi:hypothetical protein
MDESNTFWDRLRKNVSEGFRVAADRTDELARVGKLKLDLLNLKRKLNHEFSEIGRAFYAHINKQKKKDWGSIEDFSQQPTITELTEKAATLMESIKKIEADITEISTEPKTVETKPAKTSTKKTDDTTEK